jgi:hypothetical protein
MDIEKKVLIESNRHQEVVDLHSNFFALNGTRDKLSSEHERITNLIKDSNRMSQVSNNELMISMEKQALNLLEINANIAKLSLFQLNTPCLKTVHGTKRDKNNLLDKIRKHSSLNDIYECKDTSSLFKNMNSDSP